MINVDSLDFSKNPDGLIPVIAQEESTGSILMVAFANKEAIKKTIETKLAHFFSRSKNRLWCKGEESGNLLKIKNIVEDCDNDTVIYFVDPLGNTCHTGAKSCFYKNKKLVNFEFLSYLQNKIKIRSSNPDSYINALFTEGLDKVAQKVGEEAVEMVIASKNNNKDDFLAESADLLFHFLLLLTKKGLSLDDVIEILKKRDNKNN